MKIRSQVGMVLNLDKCIGCHTCSVTCKNVWTGREGMEYAWFNNVETKPGIGYPKNWEDQDEWQGGWVRDVNGKIRPRLGSKMGVITKIFANPVVPQIDDYYEPFTFDYEHLHSAPEGKHIPTARPRSLIDGKRMDKVIWGPNWEELLGGEFEKRARDRNFEAMQKEMYGQFENTFMMYLPRLCEHCLNPSCVATCPSGAIYTSFFTISTRTCVARFLSLEAGCATTTGSTPGAPPPARCWINAGWCCGRTCSISAFWGFSSGTCSAC